MVDAVTRKRLLRMEVGETRIFRETTKKKSNAGSSAQSYACRAGIKIATEAVLVVMPKTAHTIKAVGVTRLS